MGNVMAIVLAGVIVLVWQYWRTVKKCRRIAGTVQLTTDSVRQWLVYKSIADSVSADRADLLAALRVLSSERCDQLTNARFHQLLLKIAPPGGYSAGCDDDFLKVVELLESDTASSELKMRLHMAVHLTIHSVGLKLARAIQQA